MSHVQKLCADCQHMRINPKNKRHGPVCAASAFAVDLVSGDPVRCCGSERLVKSGPCGLQGLLFKQRDPGSYVAWISRPGPLLDAGLTA